MNTIKIEGTSTNKKFRDQVRSCKTLQEKILLIHTNGRSISANHIIDFNTLDEFYYPQIGKFIVSHFNGKRMRFKKCIDAVGAGVDIMVEIEKCLNSER